MSNFISAPSDCMVISSALNYPLNVLMEPGREATDCIDGILLTRKTKQFCRIHTKYGK